MNKLKHLEAKLAEAATVAKKSLPELEKQCAQTKGKVAGAVEDAIPDFHAAAVHAKTQAVWDIMELANQRHLQPLLPQAMQLINRTFAGRNISALDITDVVNVFVNQAHNQLLQLGCSFSNVCSTFACNPEMKGELYAKALPQGTDEALALIMSEAANKIGKGEFLKTEDLVAFLLEKLATFYAAKHVIQTYEASSSSTAEA